MTDLSPKNTEPTKKNQNNNKSELAGDYNVDLIRKFYEIDGMQDVYDFIIILE